MRPRDLLALAAALNATAGAPQVLAQTAPHGREPGAIVAGDCSRDCLIGLADRYMAALLRHDPSGVPWARAVVFTENNVQLQVGDGLWNTLTSISASSTLRFADPATGQAGYFTIIKEGEEPEVYNMRTKVEGGRITEVESIIDRKTAAPGASDPPEQMQQDPVLLQDVPVHERAPRERMTAFADGYFNSLERNDGTLFAPFDPMCARIEHGRGTDPSRKVGPAPVYPDGKLDYRQYLEEGKRHALSCSDSLMSGFFRPDTAIRDRRFVMVDEQKGLVLGIAFIDHAADVHDYLLSDGTTLLHSDVKHPYTTNMFELFKISHGRIRFAEAALAHVPYRMPSVWAARSCIEPH
jgi:hypothetical protein